MKKKIRVLIIDDSAMVRQMLTEVLNSDPEIEVIGTAADPFIAARKMMDDVPDVITLDVEMPRMDGVTFLEKIMTQHPIPVVICSSLTIERSETAMKVMEYGAVEIIQKPVMGTKAFFRESKIRICDRIKAEAMAKVKKIVKTRYVAPKLTADAVLSKPANRSMVETT